MLGRCFEPETNNRKWIWIILIITLVAVMVFFLCKKKRKKKNKFDTDSYDYLTTGDECIACCQNENHDIGICTKGA